MKAWFRSLLFAGVQYTVAEALLQSDAAKRRLGRLLRGVILLGLAGVLASFAGLFLLASLFFALADVTRFVMPALVTGLVAAAIVIVFAGESWWQLRK